MSGSPFPDEITALLADDEDMAIHRLKKALQAHPRIRITGEVKNGPAAVAFINAHRPDLVFLDIQMPGCNGFEVLRQLEYTPIIVFVTAYEEYAVKAFEQHSLDYLLKPVEAERLALTIRRVVQQKTGEADTLLKIQKLLQGSQPEEVITTIPVKTGNKIQLIHLSDIYYFEAKDKYVIVHTKEEEKLIDYSLTWLEGRLPATFVRIHRGYIINKLKVREIQKHIKGTFLLVMEDARHTRLQSAYSYYDAIKTKLLQP